MLTAGVDMGTAFEGTEKGDVFNAFDVTNPSTLAKMSTLDDFDTLDGKAGNDTLNIATGKAINIVDLNLTSIETVNVKTAAAITNLDGSNWNGTNTLNVTQATAATVTAAATTDVNVSGVTGAIVVKGGNDVVVTDSKAGSAITVSNGATGNATGTITVTDTNQGTGNIIVDGGTDVTVTASATATSGTLTIGGNKSASEDVVVVSNLNTDGTTAATGGAIAVTGGKTVNVTVNGTVVSKDYVGNVALVNSGVTVTADNTTTDVTVKQTTSVTDYRVAEVAEVKATQTITFKDLAATKNVVINGLTFTATKNLTAAEVAAAFANLTDSDKQSATGITDNGVFTGPVAPVAGWTSAAANGATVTFTAPLHSTTTSLVTSTSGATALTVGSIVPGTATVTAIDSDDTAAYGAVVIDDNATASITTVTVDGYASAAIGTTGAATALTKLANLSLANSGGTATIDTAAGITSLNLTLNNVNHAIDISTNSTTVATLNVTTAGEDSDFVLTAVNVKDLNVSGTADLDLTGSALTALENVVVSGTAGLDLGTVVASKSINTTATTGDVTASINGTAATYTGGAGVDTVTLVIGTALTKAIDLGAGDDTLSFAALNVTGSTATLSGGTGTDTLSMATATAANLDGNETFKNSISGFERLTLNDTFGTNDAIVDTETINLANLGFASYVTTKGTNLLGGAFDILILDKLAANATVGLTANGLITAQLADATGTTDVINVEISNNAGNVGTFTAAAVETINVTTTDTFTDTSGAFDVEGDPIGDGLDDANSTATLALTTAAATKINVTGAGDLTLTTTSTVLTTIDASTMTGALTYNAVVNSVTVNAGSGDDVLTVTADSLKINAGAGNDLITIVGGADLAVIDGGAGADTFNFTGVSTNKSNYAVIKGVNSGDVIKVTGATSFSATEITLAQGATETTQAYLDQAMTTLSAGQIGWFQLNGNTYVTADLTGDSANSFADGTDFVVMITGLKDLGTGASYNATSNTLEIA